MKKFKIYPLLVALLMLLTACSAVPESIAGNAALGESIATQAVADVVQPESPDEQMSAPEADSQASEAAQTEADPPTPQDTPVASTNLTTRTQPPVITEARQGLTYGPDQLVLVFAEGFQPDATVSVSAMHETEGIVKSASANANALGEILIYHYVQHSAEDSDAYPAGEITFRLRTSTGSVKTYAFRIDYENAPALTPAGCGSYPASVHLGGSFAIWCGGFAKEDFVDSNYQLGYSISHAGNTLLTSQTDVLADGLAIAWLTTESGDPVGSWDITIGDQSFQVQIEE
jgi:hypothetical protein